MNPGVFFFALVWSVIFCAVGLGFHHDGLLLGGFVAALMSAIGLHISNQRAIRREPEPEELYVPQDWQWPHLISGRRDGYHPRTSDHGPRSRGDSAGYGD